jgi:hypothetical protein
VIERARLPAEVAAVADRWTDESQEISNEAQLKLLKIKKGVPESQIAETLQFLKKLPATEEVRALVVELLRQWAESDIQSAAKWAESLPTGLRAEALNGVAIKFAEQYPLEAMTWVCQIQAGEERNLAVRSVGYEVASTDPIAGLTLVVTELPDTPDRNELIKHLVLQWAAVAPADSALWANEVPDTALRERLLSNIATVWGDTDPFSAAQLAVQALTPGRAQDDAVVGIVQRWAQVDPRAASEWVLLFPEGPLAETAAENIISLWPENTP